MFRRLFVLCALACALVVPVAHPSVTHAYTCNMYQYTDQWYTHENNPQNPGQTDYVQYKTTYYYSVGCGAHAYMYDYAAQESLSSSQWASLRLNAVTAVGVTGQDQYGRVCAALPNAAYFQGVYLTPQVNQLTEWGNAYAVGCATFDSPIYTYTHQPT